MPLNFTKVDVFVFAEYNEHLEFPGTSEFCPMLIFSQKSLGTHEFCEYRVIPNIIQQDSNLRVIIDLLERAAIFLRSRVIELSVPPPRPITREDGFRIQVPSPSYRSTQFMNRFPWECETDFLGLRFPPKICSDFLQKYGPRVQIGGRMSRFLMISCCSRIPGCPRFF